IADAQAVLRKYGIAAPGPFSETPKPGDPLFARVENRVVATAMRSLEAAAARPEDAVPWEELGRGTPDWGVAFSTPARGLGAFADAPCARAATRR
ncbi:MAG: glycerate kinase, partial [Gaiellales bacterium]